MIEQTEVVAEQQPEPEVNYKELYEESQKAIEALASKKDELLAETKKAKDERRKADEVADKARQEQLDIAKKNGEYEKLWKQEAEEKNSLLQTIQKDRQDRRNEKIELTAMKMAVELSKGDPDKAELLKEFLGKSLSNVADEYGHLDEDVISSVSKQFETDKRYTPLLGGNQSVGGGAPGNSRSAAHGNTMSREDFAKLSPFEQGKFFSNVSNKLTD